MGIRTCCYVYYVNQRGGIPLQSVLRAVTVVKIKVNSQLEIFSIDIRTLRIRFTGLKILSFYSNCQEEGS